MAVVLAGLINIIITIASIITWEVIKHMRRTNKHYRFSYHTMDKLDILRNLIPGQTETSIVETAICDYCDQMLIREGQHIETTRNKVQLIQIYHGSAGK